MQLTGRYQVHFELTSFNEVAPGVMVPLNYNHWKPLILYFVLRSTTFRVDCWNTEIDAIKSIKPFAERVDVQTNDDRNLVNLQNSLPILSMINDPFGIAST